MSHRSVVALLLILAIPAAAQDPKETLATALKAVVDANVLACNQRDIEAYMLTLHSKSPGALETRTQLADLNKQYELAYRVLSYGFIGSDADYAVARIKQETRKLKGPEFQNNEIDMMQSFRKEKGVWKVWTTSILEVKFVD